MYRIMLVDDEENMLSILQRDLVPLRCKLEVFTQPRKALERAGEADFDLVIVDYRMPSMDGVTLVKALKKIHPELIVIMLSGLADLRAIMSAINESEVYRYLTKPWDAEKLNATIFQALEQRANNQVHQKQRELRQSAAKSFPESKGAMAALEAKYPGITRPDVEWEAG